MGDDSYEPQNPNTKAYLVLKRLKEWSPLTTVGVSVLALLVIGAQAYIYWRQSDVMERTLTEVKVSGDAATKSANTAADSLVLAQRPWVKIKHRVVQPLTFNVQAWKGPVATIAIEDTLENVGPSVAVNVSSWEDVIPLDNNGGYQTALARRSQWCDANRQQNGSLSGYMLFPRDPFIQTSRVGPPMETVAKAVEANFAQFQGKVGFALVGCVVYRSVFEPASSPAHETKFMYYLGEVQGGGVNPYVFPMGVASGLQLVALPDGFSAD